VSWEQEAVRPRRSGAGPFEGAGDRFDARVEHIGHLVGVVANYLAQDEHGTLASGQNLQCGHEGQGDGFGLFVACLWAERHASRTLEEGVGIWLQPHDFAEPTRFGRFNIGIIPLLGRASAGRAKRVETSSGGDAVEPCPDRGASVESSEAAPGSQQRILESVLGVLEGSEHAVAVHQ
jgi:hypothetical protein